MEINYQGTDITDMVLIRRCIIRDTCGKRCDSLEIEFENSKGWYSWAPKEDDKIIVTHNGYDSGTMYVNMVLPEDGKYRIMAASLPCRARGRQTRSFIKKTVGEIMQTCAAASGMGCQIFGVNAQAVIPYIEQDNEGCGAFLCRLLALEGAVLKCVNGRYTAIGIPYAQGLPAGQTIEIAARNQEAMYRREGTSYRTLTVKTPYAGATAEDTAAAGSHAGLTVNGLPAMDNAQAARWARGKLLYLNRQCESIDMPSEFNPGFTAMARIDITGNTDATGQWLVEEAEHDLMNLTTRAKLYRCLTSVR